MNFSTRIEQWRKVIQPYLMAFLAAFILQIGPPLSAGQWPNSRHFLGAILAGILATHLLDRPSPRKTANS